jgi:hypothetical protein
MVLKYSFKVYYDVDEKNKILKIKVSIYICQTI